MNKSTVTAKEKMTKTNRPNKALLLALYIFAALLVLQCGFYVYVFLTRQNTPGRFVKQRRGTLRTIASDTPYVDTLVNIQGYSLTQVCRYFTKIALTDEGLDYRDTIRKWTTPILFYADGSPDQLVDEILQELFVKMNAVDGFPGIQRVYNKAEANFIGYFLDEEEFLSFSVDYGGNKYVNGLSKLELNESDYSVHSGLIIVRNELPDIRRRHVICEELVQAMGLQNDSYVYPDSLFYQDYSEVTEPSALDWIIFRILYHPLIQSGMNYDQIIPILTTIIEH